MQAGKKLCVVCWLALAPAGQAEAQIPLGLLAPGTVLDATGTTVQGAGETAYCMINPSIAGQSGSQSFVTLGPAATGFQQNKTGSPVILTFPGLAQGELITSNGQTEAAYTYFSQGTAVLVFSTGSSSGTITFLGSGNSLPNKTIKPTFSGYAASYNAATGRLYVSFGIRLGPCSVPFRGAFQA
jgi:hypothetical protein